MRSAVEPAPRRAGRRAGRSAAALLLAALIAVVLSACGQPEPPPGPAAPACEPDASGVAPANGVTPSDGVTTTSGVAPANGPTTEGGVTTDDGVATACPVGADPELELLRRRQAEAYAALSAEDQARVGAGQLVWNGYGYSLRPPVLVPGRPGHAPSPLAAQAEFTCPLDYRSERPGDAPDWGTFYLRGTRPGTRGAPLAHASASLVVPASTSISREQWEHSLAQEPFVLIAGWGADIGAASSAFDAGLGWQAGGGSRGGHGGKRAGWYMLTNRSVPGTDDPHQTYTAYLYRLRNLDEDGRVVPEDRNTAPFTIDLEVEVVEDGRIRVTARPTGDTAWVQPYTGEVLLDPETDRPAALVLGGDEVGTPNRGNYDAVAGAYRPFPQQAVPGMRADGVDNRWAVQVNLARDHQAPAKGSRIPGIEIYNLQAGGRPWEITDDHSPGSVQGFALDCPPDPDRAYDVHGGSTATSDPREAFTIDIDIERDDVHGCVDEAGYWVTCKGPPRRRPPEQPGAAGTGTSSS